MSFRSFHLGNNIRAWRIARGLSQSQLAAACGVSQNTISSFETGHYCPSAFTAFKLCRALNVKFDSLFYFSDEYGCDPDFSIDVYYTNGFHRHYSNVSWVTDDEYHDGDVHHWINLVFNDGSHDQPIISDDIDFILCGCWVCNVSSVGIKGGKS